MEPTRERASYPPSPNYRVMNSYEDYLAPPGTDPDVDRTIQPDDRILLVRLSAIGDSIRMLPVVEYLRNNEFTGTLDVITEPPSGQFLSIHPDINEVIQLPLELSVEKLTTIYRVVRKLRSKNYDWLFDFHGLLKSGVASFLSGAERRVGYSRSKSREFNHWFQSILLRNPLDPTMPRILKYLQMVRSFSPNYEFNREVVRPRLPNLSAPREALCPATDREYVIFHPFTSHSRYGKDKEWGPNNNTKFLEKFLNVTNQSVRITWGPGEEDRARELLERVQHPNLKLAPRTKTLRELAFFVQNASLVVSVDTSIAHVADFLGRPLVVLFGGSSYTVNSPLFTEYRALFPEQKHQKTGGIEPEAVIRKTRDLMLETSGSP